MKPAATERAPAKAAAERSGRGARDFYGELIQESQLKPALLAERERWLRSLRVEGREELLFEFEMLLRGIERYFNLHNLALDPKGEPVIARDFHPELLDLRDALNQAIRLARRLMDPNADQRMVFRRYVESQTADDRVRRALIEQELEQLTPQQSLFVLRQSFESLRTVIDHLVKLEGCSYHLFVDLGNLALREILLNTYFRPFRPLEFRIEYDRIKSVAVLEALERLPAGERRVFTVLFLGLFRLLHYLSYVGLERSPSLEPRARVILALVRSEIGTLVGYCKTELAPAVTHKKRRGLALRAARELLSALREAAPPSSNGGSDPAERTPKEALALTEAVRQQLVALALSVDGKLDPGAGFTELVSPAAMAERLRLDLWAFTQLCSQTAAALASGPASRAGEAWSGLLRFIAYFQQVSYQLVRYGDYEPFDRFTDIALELPRFPEGPVARERLAHDCTLFAEVLEGALQSVSRRSELAGQKFDLPQAEALLRRFTAG